VSWQSPWIFGPQERLKVGAVTLFASGGYTLTGIDHIMEDGDGEMNGGHDDPSDIGALRREHANR
jgi:hypothetical protein